MARKSKGYRSAAGKVDRTRHYSLPEALDLARETKRTKFDETVEIAVRLGVDPRKADQNIRGTVLLPHGTGKSVRVAVFAKGDKAQEAEQAGADVVGGGRPCQAGQRRGLAGVRQSRRHTRHDVGRG